MDNCEYMLVKNQRVIKARKALIMIKQVLSTAGNVSVKLAKTLFESKIEPILTYGSIIWATEKSTNTVTVNGLERDELKYKNVKNQINAFLERLWDGYIPQLDLVKTLGREKDLDRPILIKFSHFHDKEKLLFNTTNIPEGIQVKDNYKSNACLEIEQVQDMFLKYCINAPKLCSNVIARAELGKFPIEFKVQSSMIKYFLRLSHGTKNTIVDDAFDCAQQIDSLWFQTIGKLLKSYGFADVLASPRTPNKNTFHRTYLRRIQDIYLQEIRHTICTKIKHYMESYHVGTNYELQVCNEKIRNPCYRRSLVRLRTGTNCLYLEKGRYDNIPHQDR